MHDITVRRMEFDFSDELDPVYIEGAPEESHATTAFSLLLPYLEPYLIRTMKEAKKQVTDPDLIRDLERFCAQEGQHYRQHKRFNDVMRGAGFPCLWFAAGHERRLLPNQDGRLHAGWLRQARWEPVEVTRGDLVFFDAFVPHKSDTNRSNAPRRMLYLTYNAASSGDFRDTYYRDKLTGLEAVGDTGASGHVLMSINDDFLGRPVKPRD